jgi:hypothetical protein
MRMLKALLAITILSSSHPLAARDLRTEPPGMHGALDSPAPATSNSTRDDTLFLFAASGPGSFGSPGTDARGFTFDHAGGPAEAGWFGVDMTAQDGMWWHLAGTDLCVGTGTDMSEALPFDTGDTRNDYALWCGREEVCHWVNATGYGNDWSQYAVIDLAEHPVAAQLEVDFAYRSDFEGDDYDWFEVRVDSAGVWKTVLEDHETRDQTFREFSVTIPAADFGGGATRIGFYFHSDNAWSDEDGSYTSDVGAMWIDNIIARVDGAQVFATDFEDGLEPAELSFEGGEAAGDFATLRRNVFQEDLCILNSSYVWTFFDLDTFNPEYPIPVVAYGPPYVHNVIESPLLEVDQHGASFVHEPGSLLMLQVWIYHDNPGNALVFVEWPSIAAWRAEEGCLGEWIRQDTTTFPDPSYWEPKTIDMGLYLTESADGSTVTGFKVRAGGVVDLCAVWCDTQGDGSGHTPAPYMDTISISQTTSGDATGYAWSSERFQDSFPEPSGKVRIDSARSLSEHGDSFLAVGDSTTIRMNMDGSGGLASSFNADAGELRPELHLHWRVSAGPNAGLVEAAQADPDGLDGLWSPFTSIVSLHGMDWGTMQADSCTGYGGHPEFFSFDFNDEYFEPGDIIEYFYRAESQNGTVVTLPEWALSSDPDLRETYRVRCLPTAGHSLLLVEDNMDTSTSWRLAFEYNCCGDYDVFSRQASGADLNNSLGCRADIGQLSTYDMIVWDSGDLRYYGMSAPHDLRPCSDTPLLDDWLTSTHHDVGLWVMGNGIASNLDNYALDLLHRLFGVEMLIDYPYSHVTGLQTPRVYASHPYLEVAGQWPYFLLDGVDCPSPKSYDVIGLTGAFSEETHRWDEDAGMDMVAGALNRDPDGDGTILNAAGYNSRVLFNPFGYDQVIHGGFDPGWELYYVRSMVADILELLFEFSICSCTPVGEVPPATALNGAYPNPFNPSTTIRFSLAEAGSVKLSIYDLAGRRVRTLLDGSQEAGAHELEWRGRDDAGHTLASGVYFLRFIAGDVSDSSKLILLK